MGMLGTGKLLIKVPETMHFRLEGALQPGVMAKDVILHCIGEIGFDGATYRAMQFDGQGIANLTMDDRMTIANMAIEAGGKAEFVGTPEEAGEWLARQTQDGDVVLLKASRGVKLEKALEIWKAKRGPEQ